MEKILEMRRKRAGLVTQARELLNKADTEKRGLTAEEEQQYDKIMADVDKMAKDIEREERLAGLEGELRGNGPAAGAQGQPGQQEPEQRDNPRSTKEYRASFERFLRSGTAALTAQEIRAMQADSDTGGGYIVAAQQFVSDMLKAVDDAVIIRTLATRYQLTQAESLGVPVLNKSTDDAEWTSELKVGGETEVSFDKRELRPHPLSKMAKVSNKLMRVAVLPIEQIVRDELARIFAETMEKAYMTGDGVNKPLGLFVASKDGISTNRDISSGNTATSIGVDGLMDAKYALKSAYQARARWIFHRDAIKQIRKIKDNNGQYIWQPGITGGAPDRILEIPYLMSEFAPNTFTTGKYVGILGDFRYYWIADALDMQIQRLVELFALTNQTGFVGRLESDAMPVLEEAFVRVKLA